MNDPSPVGSEFDTAEEADAYLRWLKAKVAASIADSRPVVEHDEAMKQIGRSSRRALLIARSLWRFPATKRKLAQ
ncbi:MAG: stability determinant [Allosphingosinicella sp.]